MASFFKNATAAFTPKQVPSLSGRTFVVTGGSDGIGLSVSRTLYSHGAKLIVVSRDKQTADRAVAYIQSGKLEDAPEAYRSGFGSQQDSSSDGALVDSVKSSSVEWRQMDFEDLSNVATESNKLAQSLERLDGLYLIAGIGVNEFKLTKDGFDTHLTTNCLAHHVLVSHLLPIMVKTAGEHADASPRVISMSSELHRATYGGPSAKFGGDNFRTVDEFKKAVGPTSEYARSKLGNILFTRALVQRHLAGTKVWAFATHPGAVGTGQQAQFKEAYGETAGKILAAVTRPFMRRPDQGAISALWAGLSEGAVKSYDNGTYFSEVDEDGEETSEAQDQELVDNFYNTSEQCLSTSSAARAASSSSSRGAVYERPLPAGALPAYDLALDVLAQEKQRRLDELEQHKQRKGKQVDARDVDEQMSRAWALDPETRWHAQQGTGDLSQAVHRFLAEQAWRLNGDLAILMQRVTQMHVTPDVLPAINPTARLDITVDGETIEPGSYTKPAATRDGIALTAQTFHADERLHTLLIVDPDVPDEESQSFTTFAHLLVPNIPLSATKTSLQSDATLPFVPPHPQNGTPYHRYTALLLAQSQPLSLDASNIDRTGFSVRQFVQDNGLEPVGITFTRQIWDESVTAIYKNILGAPEPKYGKPPRLDAFAGKPPKYEMI
ncbi:hypothetical protein OIV83_005718 [Microbotryomycetes sp. JL201]|nr:hypothetical protein OIV83_005718 [Microbotryomycetes sp. JL201]